MTPHVINNTVYQNNKQIQVCNLNSSAGSLYINVSRHSGNKQQFTSFTSTEALSCWTSAAAAAALTGQSRIKVEEIQRGKQTAAVEN